MSTPAAYRDRVTGHYPITLSELRANAGVLFGEEPPAAVLAKAGVDPVEAVNQPAHDPATQTFREGSPVKVGKVWQQAWLVEDLPPPPVPDEISDRQFAEVLAIDGLITREEALAWAGPGTIPAQLETAVNQIPDDDIRFAALMRLAGATVFRRDDAYVSLLGMILGRNAAALDDIWTRAAAL